MNWHYSDEESRHEFNQRVLKGLDLIMGLKKENVLVVKLKKIYLSIIQINPVQLDYKLIVKIAKWKKQKKSDFLENRLCWVLTQSKNGGNA